MHRRDEGERIFGFGEEFLGTNPTRLELATLIQAAL